MMGRKKDSNVSAGQKLLKMYHILLSGNKPHYQSDLAEMLNCSAQTVIRLAEQIELSFPECFCSGKEKNRRWYSLQINHKNTLGLNYQELRYLSLCRELSKPFIPPEIGERIDQTLLHLSMLLLELDTREHFATSTPIAFFTKGKIDYSEKVNIIEDLLKCIENKTFCHIHYIANGNQQGKNHYFVPRKLIAMNHALYVYGAISNNVATELKHSTCLAIHRIQKLDFINQKASISIADPIENKTMFGLPEHEPRTFSIQFAKSAAGYIKERIWSDEQKIEEIENGEIILTITTSSERELNAWVRGFGEQAKMITS
ncbi:WYL domain-containing protein [Gilliamella sp. GillExp13]|uniref:WYL domain-containing protein n=1 Tax=Gilliamella sp. GillExp13 TaxID=3120243 RepID=UPI00080EE5BB|nr:WYL domain-containing protein [Gilliamella apicola]OCG59581.1 hypothetical protein A9G37_04845 [Gilliamella apicola]